MVNQIPEHKETFESFKKSFFYGTRSDMNFKFLAHLSDDQASDFFRGLLARLADAYDSGDTVPVFEHIRQSQILSYAQETRAVYDTGPFTPVGTALSQTRLMLLTSSGHFVDGDDPNPLGMENMTQTQAEQQIQSFLKESPALSAIPVDTPIDRLVVRHGGYDVRGARRDANVNLPLQRLKELLADGIFAGLSDPVYSFVGACSQIRLLKKDGPLWVQRFKAHKADAALLVPV